MKKNHLIVIPFNIPWEWSTDYTNQTAFVLGQKNIVICYLWSDYLSIKEYLIKKKFPVLIKRYSKNIFLFYPILFIPFRRFKIIVKINERLNIFLLKIFILFFQSIHRIDKKIFWIFDPNLLFIYNLFGKSWYLLYDCVDFFAVGDKKNVCETNKNEKALTQKADLVVANSTVLQKHLLVYRKGIPLVPQGFRIDGFKVNKQKYIDLHLASPVIGFVGGINNRLDTSLLLNLIKNNPKWNFVLWGPTQKDLPTGSDRFIEINKILKLPNVTTGVSTDKEEVPGLISQFDIGMIPYDIKQSFNKYCYPMKLFEFFYLGKPVVSTDIVELRRFSNLVSIGNDYKDWENIIRKLLSVTWPKKYIKEQIKIAKENSWENKLKSILINIK